MRWERCVLIVLFVMGVSIISRANTYIYSPTNAEYYKKSMYTFFDSVLRDIKLFKYDQPIALYIPFDIPNNKKVKKATLTATYDSRNFSSKNIYVALKTSYGIEEDGRDIYNINRTESILWPLQAINSKDVSPSQNIANLINQVLNNTDNHQGKLLVLLCPTQNCDREYQTNEIEIENLKLVVEVESGSTSDGGGDDSVDDGGNGGDSEDSGQDDVTVSDLSIQHSTYSNRSSSTNLEGKTLSSEDANYIYLENVFGINKVDFYINGRLIQTENNAPFDMGGTASDSSANPVQLEQLYNSRDLINGENYIHIIVNGDNSLSKEVAFFYDHKQTFPELTIISQPESQYSAFEGDQLALDVAVSQGTGEYNYSWYKNGTLIQQQTTSLTQNRLQLNELSLTENNSWYQCAVNDSVTYLECQQTQLQVQTVSISGQAYLTWQAPLYRVNGDPFYVDEIDHYQVQYWRDGSDSVKDLKIYDSLKTDLVIENLSQGTWFFKIKVIDKDGLSSQYSNTVDKTL